MPPPLDLLIIGAGPAGLTAAVAAAHRGARRILVVEQARALRPAGRVVDLLPNCMRALALVSPALPPLLDPFRRTPPPGCVRAVYVSTAGALLATTDTDRYGPLATLPWWQLQRVLLDALPPDAEVLVLNHRLVDLRRAPASGLVRAVFEPDRPRPPELRNWEAGEEREDELCGHTAASDALYEQFFRRDPQSPPGENLVSCDAKVVIGADGINSVARECVYRDAGPGWGDFARGQYAGTISVVGKGFPTLTPDEEASLREMYIKHGVMSIVSCDKERTTPSSFRAILASFPTDEKAPAAWIVCFVLSVDENTAKSAPPRTLVDIALDCARDAGASAAMLKVASQIWDATPDDRLGILRFHVVPATHPPPYDHLPTMADPVYPDGFTRPWFHGRTILIGDALHGSPNFLAQGVAMGVEDAYELITRLTESGLWETGDDGNLADEKVTAVFDDFRKARLDRICFFQNRTLNRTSEHDREVFAETRDRLWSYEPTLERV